MVALLKEPVSAGRASVRVRAFSTDAIPPHERHAAWLRQSGRATPQLFDGVAEPGFTARSETYELEPLQVSFGSFGAQRLVRSAARIRADRVDRLCVCLILSGELAVRAPPVVAKHGAVLLFDLSRAWEHFSTRCEIVTFTVARDVALANGIDPRALHCKAIAPAHAGLLCTHLVQVRERAHLLSAEDGPRLARTIVDLIAVSLGVAGRLAQPLPSSPDHAVKLKAEALIAAGVEDPKLSVAALCRQLGVSRATLYRLFAADGGVQTRIRDVRLNAARAALEEPGARIGKVGERFGFGEPAYFSRVFRAEFAITPSAYRAVFRRELGATRG